jgi:uncharacterized protein YbaR (Trm112 family)
MDILAFLREAFRCPMCRRSLADCKLRQLDHQGQKYTVEVICRHCELAFLAVLELASHDDTETDSGAEEIDLVATAAAEAEPISNDELLELHRALGGYTGPLTALIKERRDG